MHARGLLVFPRRRLGELDHILSVGYHYLDRRLSYDGVTVDSGACRLPGGVGGV
ncbi:MAG TPA: hypothetical protein VHV57_09045 [Acidimicrobiales bacterium]|nr:hypothetical protein [Acidimicrobiales bacterium]